ncbi:MAG TPA: hypothetical protein V6D17_17935 [Candidatus Obscuribacterales bacterium]
MKVKKVCYAEHGNGEDRYVEIAPSELSVDEFAQLRVLIDSSDIMEHKSRHNWPANGKHTISIVLDTIADGPHEVTFSDVELPREHQQLVEYIKELAIHHEPLVPLPDANAGG